MQGQWWGQHQEREEGQEKVVVNIKREKQYFMLVDKIYWEGNFDDTGQRR